MNTPNNVNEKETLNSLENLSDEELVVLKKWAIADEDYDKAKEVKEEQERRKLSSIGKLKKKEKISQESRINDLHSELFEGKGRNIDEEIKKEYSYETICEKFKAFAESLYIKTHLDVYEMKRLIKEGKYEEITFNGSIDQCYYYRGRELYNYLKGFCSKYQPNISKDPQKNNNKIIRVLGLKDVFNNIYRRCVMLARKRQCKEIDGEEYFETMFELFHNLKLYIINGKTKAPGFYSKECEEIDMPDL